MCTPRRRLRTCSNVVVVALAAACASQSASRARPQPVDLNAPITSRIDASSARDDRSSVTSRGEIGYGEAARYARMEDLLSARYPSLDVQPIGAGRFTLRLRGRAELSNVEPVVVIDGMRYAKGGVDMLAALAPREVRRIEVLKDAASFADARAGVNGVVVVTTWRH
jgi:outer membrane receptor protein involved in Fe transport